MLRFTRLEQPKTLEEADALAKRNKLAPLLGAGCWLRLAKRKWPLVIDLSLCGLDYIRVEEGQLCIGSMVTQRQIEENEVCRSLADGAFVKAIHAILGVQFRNMATIGGSIAGRFGFSDIWPVFLALHGQVVLADNTVLSAESYAAYRERHIIKEIRFDLTAPKVASLALRKSNADFPYITGAIRLDNHKYEIYIGGRPGIATKAQATSQIVTEEGLDGLPMAMDKVKEELTFQSNSHASESYRKAMAAVLVKRLVEEVTV